MARQKHQQAVPVPKTKKGSSGTSLVDQLSEDSWIIVKKQKVTILIPPLPVLKQSVVHDAGETLLHVPTIKPTDTQTYQVEMHTEGDVVCKMEEPMSLAPKLAIPTVAKVVPQSISQLPRPSRLIERERVETRPMPSFRTNRTAGVCSASKIAKRSIITADRSAMINKRMRAINLERKLQSAGGLRSWLVSRGLDHFVSIFQSKSINKYQLANLTMEKLKEMGSHAVGPRRKLIHAIDCLCHPFCFEHM
ncbi:uncharacterized protein LOC107796092 [Nicotiana tabacum]|uniref:SAM domain-containing protein n=2 Tax=Nicotiana TaxID=4085 RepID=A0A1S4ACP4_TOBAC|nr:PREDICTED: uncharacterized protein LOC104240577 [Nicotiana sylvestris]XP_009793743.1 PREDICTED: uncharacterized protein LOC104240577 [Nicotiana sylvestris]XP_016474307.1 PREDICTED: uncharacterized protein LOC107796092 [Nicotiana tabacum]XP_016474308.1 PREDICTED: uncharacterized protein LOC107796092 [Nicotiana tabacum]